VLVPDTAATNDPAPVTAGTEVSAARRVWRSMLDHAGRAYLAGPDLGRALAAAETLHAGGHAVTLCYWHAESEPPRTVAMQVMAMVAAAGRRSSWCDVAVKGPGLGLDEALVDEVALACREAAVRLWLDSHGIEAAEATMALALRAAQGGGEVGIAVPARWSRSRTDVVRAREAGLWVRLVKGQWPDDQPRHADVRDALLLLLQDVAGSGRVAVASHDAVLLQRALQGTPAPAEIQLLHSVPSRPAASLAAASGVPVRFYVPFGHPSLIYSPRNVWENRRIAWWLARDLLRASRPVS
jgi:proline dehydrogenase